MLRSQIAENLNYLASVKVVSRLSGFTGFRPLGGIPFRLYLHGDWRITDNPVQSSF